jgi:UDP:flavonoid glycosyltransferase YjiC (YdhE family)
LLAREDALVQNINAVHSQQGKRPVLTLQEAVCGDIDLLATLPELDHYPGRRNGRFIGPILYLDGPALQKWSGSAGPRIFVYLRPFSGIEQVLESLARSNADVIACIPGLDDHLAARHAHGYLQISSTPVRLSDLLSEMDLVISHAGHGVMVAALLAGVPMLMLPTTIEQWLLSMRVVSLGAGMSIRRDKAVVEFPDVLARMLADGSFRGAAERLAHTYAGYDHNRTVERLANTIERLPAWMVDRPTLQAETYP